MATFSVANQAQLDSAIQSINVGGANGTTSTSHTITLTASFTLSSSLWVVNLPSGSSVVIDGGGHTIDGNNLYRGFFDFAGGLTLRDMTISNTLAQGGRGGDGSDYGGAGGGGAGLGGGLFVGSSGQATLDGVNFLGNRALGGNSGTYGGSGVPGGGGGGGGLGSNGANGGAGQGGVGGVSNIPGLSFSGGTAGTAAIASPGGGGTPSTPGGSGSDGGGGGGGGGADDDGNFFYSAREIGRAS